MGLPPPPPIYRTCYGTDIGVYTQGIAFLEGAKNGLLICIMINGNKMTIFRFFKNATLNLNVYISANIL